MGIPASNHHKRWIFLITDFLEIGHVIFTTMTFLEPEQNRKWKEIFSVKRSYEAGTSHSHPGTSNPGNSGSFGKRPTESVLRRSGSSAVTMEWIVVSSAASGEELVTLKDVDALGSERNVTLGFWWILILEADIQSLRLWSFMLVSYWASGRFRFTLAAFLHVDNDVRCCDWATSVWAFGWLYLHEKNANTHTYM